MKWMFWLFVSCLYAHLYRFLHFRFKVNIPGLGWLMRRIDRDLVLPVDGVKMFMYSPIAGSNAMHLIGQWNEPETHLFLNTLLSRTETPVNFVDVGANVGEMVMDMARNGKVESIQAFEPVADCVHAIRISAVLNAFNNVVIHHTAVSASAGKALFRYDVANPSWSGIKGSGDSTIEVPLTTLDTALGPDLRNPVLLLDVEGEERNVMAGAKRIIDRWSPPIIFEYNHVSRAQYDLEQVRAVLGDGYELYRLRQSDGLLDTDFRDTWNCVAVHRDSIYYAVCRSLCVAKDGKTR